MATINEIINDCGPIISATRGETPCGNSYLISWNEKETFHLYIFVPNNYYESVESDYEEVDVRTVEVVKYFPDAKYFAQQWLREIIEEEETSLEELLISDEGGN